MLVYNSCRKKTKIFTICVDRFPICVKIIFAGMPAVLISVVNTVFPFFLETAFNVPGIVFHCHITCSSSPVSFLVPSDFPFKNNSTSSALIIISPYINSISLLPIPVWENMQYRFICPFALIHIINIFRKTGQVNNTKIRTACRPWIRCWLS